ERIAALKCLHDTGLKTWVSIEPYPTPNIIKQNLTEILEAVSFADKIVFGRLNYSPLVKAFTHADDFYSNQAEVVADFCRSNKIGIHIKNGTLKN
ncbi:MAG: radical SAM protein, partial [Thermodesulfovibrio sp.]|nr:radical SAM protein [Thermodesulfovibrio sp.]